MNLTENYVDATEWNLATLSELCRIKSSSQRRIKRQTNICFKMLQVCQEYESEVNWRESYNGGSSLAPRTWKILKTAKGSSEGLMGTLLTWRKKVES